MTAIKTPKKLIEVALPLDDINAACAREKSIRHGHPSTLHLWWARRPLAAARAVIFAQMVNDPGFESGQGFKRGLNKKDAQRERDRLFEIIRKLVLWENTNNETVLEEAREEIRKSWRETCEMNKNHPQAAELFNPEKLPAFHDPFAGGGAIPLEAQRLGLESHASDLNPVAVLINKAMIEIPPKFAGRAPVGPQQAAEKGRKKDATKDAFTDWSGAKGLAEDVRRYGAWMREEAFKRIGHLYPQVDLPKEQGGGKATVIAWLWARTVKSPNPAFSHVDVPLASTFILSSKAGKEAYVQPVIDGDNYHFEIRSGKPPESAKNGTKLARGANFQCLLSGSPIEPKYIKAEGMAGRMGQKLMAIVAEGTRGRIYVAPSEIMEKIASEAKPDWKPETDIAPDKRSMFTPLYGLTKFSDLFTPRQLVALTTFSDLVQEAREKIKADALQAGMADPSTGSGQAGIGLDDGGNGATAYADAVAVYLGLNIGRLANRSATLNFWDTKGENVQQVFARQALPMTWDFVEGNPLSSSSGNFLGQLDYLTRVISDCVPCEPLGAVFQQDAQTQSISINKVISTDPPYYDNIGYADLSDFFYVWLRRALKPIYPTLFATMAVPKAEELVATPYRHGSKQKAEAFFLEGMTEAMHQLSEQANPVFPVTIYYAFKQSDTTDIGTGNTGWETFLEAVLRAGFMLSGTWPMRTEYTGNLKKSMNALASSIVLVCRKREVTATTISRREFLRELKEELSIAVETMIGGAEGISPVAPVDLAQAVIGPGMAIFSKYASVLEADGSAMTVHTALQLINRALVEGGDEFDADTQFCLGWFDEQGWSAGEFGQADVLARAKGTSVQGVQEAGVIEAGAGKVRLLKPAEYAPDWSPENDNRTPVWEALHYVINTLQTQGEAATGALLAKMPERAEPMRALAYRLYTLCERKKWAEEARAYNEISLAWNNIVAASHDVGHTGTQTGLDF
jgi:putative DNA methylase